MATIMKNARGGIDKLSNREMRGVRPQGATGAQGQLEMPAIPATALTPTAPMKLPATPVPEDPGDVISSNNVGLATDGSLSLTGNQLAPALPEAPEAPKDNLGSIFNQYMGQMEAPGSTADIYAEEAARAGLEEKRKTFNNLSARLNSITANRDASILKLEGENMDKGVTKNVFAGQAARINREAAIQALPVQAQLAAAQGNLEMAEAHVDKMFAIKAQDAQAQYQFKGKVLDAVYEFATDQEKRRLDEVKAQEERKYEEQQDFLKTQRSLLSSALQQGAPSSVVNAINGATTQEEALIAAGQYNGDILARQAQQAQLRSANANAALNEYQLVAAQDAAAARKKAIENGQLLPEQSEAADSIDKEFRGEPVVKEYNIAVSKRGPALEIINNGVSGVQDLLLVYEFMKSVDPTSVVRESEFDNAAKSGNIFAGQWTKFNKGYFGAGGFLPSEVKSSFISALNSAYTTRTNQYLNVKSEFGEKVNNRLGIQNGADYLTDYENAAPIESTLPANDSSDDPLGLFGSVPSKFDSFTQSLMSPSPY